MAVEGDRPAGVPRAAERRRAQQGRYLGIGFATFSERTGYGTPGLRGARHGDHAGLGDRRARHGPVRLRRGADRRRRRTARACARRWRRSSPTRSASRRERIKVIHGDTDRTPYGWGTFASRSLVISGGATLDRGAQGARQADQASPATCWKRRRTTSCWRTAHAKVAGTDRTVTHRDAGARGLHADPRSAARSSRA